MSNKFEEEHEYFYPKMMGDIGIRGPPDLKWIRPYILLDFLSKLALNVCVWFYRERVMCVSASADCVVSPVACTNAIT